MDDILKPNPVEAWEFVRFLNPDGPFYLERMNSAGSARPVGRKFSADDRIGFERFVLENNSERLQRNIYFLHNAAFLNGKRNKANVRQSQYLHIDIDMKDFEGNWEQQDEQVKSLLFEQSLQPGGVPTPSTVWFTGGGYQAIWMLSEPISPDVAEDYNKWLCVALKGDKATVNVDRLLRLPGTINWLNEKKRDAGRKPALAYWVSVLWKK